MRPIAMTTIATILTLLPLAFALRSLWAIVAG
jgi:multidrug efflux pump subunit AcrB